MYLKEKLKNSVFQYKLSKGLISFYPIEKLRNRTTYSVIFVSLKHVKLFDKEENIVDYSPGDQLFAELIEPYEDIGSTYDFHIRVPDLSSTLLLKEKDYGVTWGILEKSNYLNHMKKYRPRI